MTHGSLFSGIGGFDLAAEWMGWENKFHCEYNEFCKKVLKKHFPNSIGYGNIIETDFSIWNGLIDVITGGFPCQPYSQAGKRKGKEDNRHLWPEMLRAAIEIQPRWIIGENVPGIINWSKGMVVNEIKTNLEDAGFTLLPPVIIPACAKDAPHRRDRVWFIAHYNNAGIYAPEYDINKTRETAEQKQQRFTQSEYTGLDGLPRTITNSDSIIGFKRRTEKQIQRKSDLLFKFERGFESFRNRWNLSAPRTCGNNDGIPNRVDRIKSLGNAIVPQIAYEIFKTIEQYELLTSK